jgi:serine O-acetyltransferase
MRTIVDAILDSYRLVGGLNNVDGANLPSKQAVDGICVQLLQLMFPGYHDQEPLHSSELGRLTGYRVSRLSEALLEEVAKSLRLVRPDCPKREAETLVNEFMQSFPKLREFVQGDVEAADEGDPAATSREEIIVAYPSIEAVTIQRMAHCLHKLCVPLLPRMMTEWAHSRTGIDIHPGASLGSRFFIDHGTGVVIGETCVIGSRVKLYHGVTLGARSFERDSEGRIRKGGKRHPDVEDNVTIYPNSTILGGDTVIGQNSTIGGNVFLQHSVPPDSLVYYEERSLRVVNKLERRKDIPDWVI